LVGPLSGQDIYGLIDNLLRLDATSRKPITLWISCQGGSIIDTLTVCDTLALLRSPIQTVGLGYVEGTGLALLASGTERVIYSSLMASTHALWSLPSDHPGSRTIGIRKTQNQTEPFMAQLIKSMARVVAESKGRFPSFLADPNVPDQIMDATTIIEQGIADGMISGSARVITNRKQNNHVKTLSI
jgi:ATP-dependent Clp protease protease subunit